MEQMISVAVLRPRKDNRLVGGETGIEALADSIRAKGVLNALIVRECEGQARGEYEVVAGNRRLAAAKLLGLESVKCDVRDMSDEEADAVAAIDNLMREGLHPLDEAGEVSRLVATIRETGAPDPVARAAAAMGVSETYVRQRLALLNLSGDWRKVMKEDKTFTLGHALVIARLPEALQKEILEDWGYNDWTVEDLRETVARELMQDLGRAPFDGEDEGLVPAAGKCSLCPKRTGAEPSLFPEVKKGDRCLDGKCFRLKVDAHVGRARAELEAAGRPFMVASSNYGVPGALSPHEWVKVKKSEEGAQPVLVVDGERAGSVAWGIPGSPRAERQAETGGNRMTAKQKAERRAKILDKKVERAGTAAVLEATLEAFTNSIGRVEVDRDALEVVAQTMFAFTPYNLRHLVGEPLEWQPRKRQYGGPDWEAEGKKRIAQMSGLEMLLVMARCAVAQCQDKYAPDSTRLHLLADALEVDHKEIRAGIRKRMVEAAEAKRAARGGKKKGAPAKKRGGGRKKRIEAFTPDMAPPQGGGDGADAEL